MVCFYLQCTSCASQAVTLLAFPPHPSQQLLCPSRHFVHFFLRHTFTSVAFSSPAANYFARRQPHYGCVQQVLAHAQFQPHLCSFVPHFTKQHWQHTKFHCWNYPSVIFERNKADFADIAGIYGEKSNAVAAKNNHG